MIVNKIWKQLNTFRYVKYANKSVGNTTINTGIYNNFLCKVEKMQENTISLIKITQIKKRLLNQGFEIWKIYSKIDLRFVNNRISNFISNTNNAKFSTAKNISTKGTEEIYREMSLLEVRNASKICHNPDNEQKYRYDQTLSIILKFQKTIENLKGKEDDTITKYYFMLGTIYFQKGEYQKSIEYLTKVTTSIEENKEKILAIDDAIKYDYLGKAFFEIEEYDKALINLKKSLRIMQDINGMKYPITQSIYNRIGTIYLIQAEYENAIEYLQISLKMLEEVNREKKLMDMSDICEKIAMAYYHKEEYDQGLQFSKKSLEIAQKILGDNHPNIVTHCNSIASAYLKKNKVDLALEYLAKSSKIVEESLGDKDDTSALFYSNIGLAYLLKEDFNKAIEYLSKSARIMEALFGNKDCRFAQLYKNLGFTYFNNGEPEKALHNFIEESKILSEIFGDKHIETVSCYKRIGLTYSKIKEYDEAISYYIRSLNIIQELLGDNHIDVARYTKDVGLMYAGKGEYKKTLEYYSKALVILEKTLGDMHLDILEHYTDIIEICMVSAKFDKGREYLKKALKISQKHGDNHPEAGNIYNYMGMIYELEGKYEKARKCFLKCLEILKKFDGKVNYSAESIYESLQECEIKINKTE